MKPRVAGSFTVPCAKCPLIANPAFRKFTPEELRFVQSFKSGETIAEPGTVFLHEGQSSEYLYTVLQGWGFKSKALPDDRRQIVAFLLPGDFVGLQGPVFDEMQHSVEALTRLKLCMFPRSRLWELFSNHPGLGYDVAWLSARTESIADEHLLAVGQRSASERIAYLIVHLFDRCKGLQMTKGSAFSVPANQQHFADALGLSLVHTNKTLRRLQGRGLIRWSPGAIEILNDRGLRDLAGHPAPDTRQRPLI